MRILFVNPNITPQITETMAAEARRSASAGTEIIPATAPFGTFYIENRVEAAIAAHALLEVLAAQGSEADAAIVSAFGDPGVMAARELMDIPIVGVSEAAFHTAYLLGKRYAIVCLTARLRTWYLECAEEHGLAGRLVAARALDRQIPDITKAREELAEALLAECLAAVEKDDAEVVILGGGPIAGLARELAHRVPVPLLDGVSCAVRLTEALVGLDARPPQRGSFARPTAKPSRGLSPELAKLIEHERAGEKNG